MLKSKWFLKFPPLHLQQKLRHCKNSFKQKKLKNVKCHQNHFGFIKNHIHFRCVMYAGTFTVWKIQTWNPTSICKTNKGTFNKTRVPLTYSPSPESLPHISVSAYAVICMYIVSQSTSTRDKKSKKDMTGDFSVVSWRQSLQRRWHGENIVMVWLNCTTYVSRHSCFGVTQRHLMQEFWLRISKHLNKCYKIQQFNVL